jgi:hypothetical protein
VIDDEDAVVARELPGQRVADFASPDDEDPHAVRRRIPRTLVEDERREELRRRLGA